MHFLFQNCVFAWFFCPLSQMLDFFFKSQSCFISLFWNINFIFSLHMSDFDFIIPNLYVRIWLKFRIQNFLFTQCFFSNFIFFSPLWISIFLLSQKFEFCSQISTFHRRIFTLLSQNLTSPPKYWLCISTFWLCLKIDFFPQFFETFFLQQLADFSFFPSNSDVIFVKFLEKINFWTYQAEAAESRVKRLLPLKIRHKLRLRFWFLH